MSLPVYVDFDDVLCESARTLAGIAAERYGKVIAFERIYSFDLNQSFGLNVLEQEDLFRLFHDEDLLGSIPPIPDAIRGMQQWARAGCRIEIVTGRPPETQAISCAWLNAHEVPFDGIIFVDKYQRGHGLVDGVVQKTREEIARCHYSLVVDDSPEMIAFLADSSALPLALFDRPWNQHLAVQGLRAAVNRYENWEALLAAHPAPGV